MIGDNIKNLEEKEKLLKIILNKVKIRNLKSELEKIDFEEIIIWQEFWKEKE